MKRFYFLAIAITLSLLRLSAFAQTDTAFWFVAPDVSIGDNNDLDRPINLDISTYSLASTVTISEPANSSFTPIVVTLAANSSTEVQLTNFIYSIENAPPNTVLSYGIYIRATNPITAYYQVLGGVGCSYCNPEAFSLKGHTALGTSFYTPFQQTFDNSGSYSPPPYSAFDIVSPQDSTQVTITPTQDIVGHVAGTPFTIMLNKGQTFSCTATSQVAANHPSGSTVTSNKPVAITVKDDLVQETSGDGGQDLEGDQLIPVNVIGNEYIVVQCPGAVNDIAVIVATQNGTQISVNGTVATTIDAGQTYQYPINTGADYITSTLPIYVYQLTTSGGEVGGAIIPPLTCTGSSDVCVNRATPQQFYIFLITQNGNQGNFLCNGSSTEITSSLFSGVPGTSGNWVYASVNLSNFIGNGLPCRVTNSSGLFAMAELFGVDETGSSYAYFSNFITPSNPVIPVSICNISATLQPTVSGTHLWNTGSTADSIIVTQAGTYWVQNSLTGGCTVTDTFNVTVSVPSVVVTPSSPSICIGNSVSLTASGESTYQWNPSTGLSATNGATVTANPTTTTIYSITGSSGTGCSVITYDTVVVNPVPVVSISPLSASLCNGQNVLLTSSGASTYQWSPATGLSATGGSSVTANPTVTTTYTAIGASSSGCTDTATIIIKVDPPIQFNITPAAPSICLGQSVILNTSGSYTYQWSPSTALSATAGSSVTANPATTTTYTITATDLAACTKVVSVTVTVNPVPVVSIAPPSAAICKGKSVVLTANGASTYQWSPSTGLSSTTNSNIQANPTINTTYTIIGTSLGCSDTTSIPIRVIQDSLKASTTNVTACQGSPVLITASGASNYVWSPSTGLNPATGDSVIATPISTTTYTLTATGINGCLDTISPIVVKINLPPVVTISPLTPQICIGQSIPLTVSGASTYHWSPSTGLSSTNGSSIVANPTATTIYTAYGTNLSGCIDSVKVLLKVNPLPIISIAPPNPAICRGYSTTLTASGASTYVWSPSTALSSITNSAVIANPSTNTTYNVSGTDSLGCIDSAKIALRVVQDSLKAAITDTSICQGNSAVLTASGDYGYVWSPSTGLNQTTGNPVTANPTLTTTYTLIGTGPIGCLDTQTVVVNIYLPPTLAVTPPSPQICIGHPTTLNVSGASTYYWSPSTGLSLTTGSSVSANPTVLTTYTAYGTDVHGCNDSAKVAVKVNPLPNVIVAPLDSIVCNGLSVPLTVRGASTYQWSPAARLNSTTDSDIVAAPLATTTYTVYGTDNLGCTDTVTAIVKIIPNTIVITVVPTNSVICLGNSAFIEAIGGTHYSWSPSVGISATTGDTLTANPVSTTTYTVIGTGLGDCADTTIAIITVSPPPVIAVQPASPVICYGQAIPLTASGAATYTWSPSTGLYETSGSAVDAHSVVTTGYTVYGTDSLFCNDSTKFTLTVKPSPVSSFTTGIPSICDPLQIQFSNTSTDGVSYFWNFGDGDTSTEQNPSHLFPKTGIYTITLISTSENGCMDTLISADTLTNAHSNLFVANSFTPSIPGANQTFKPNIVCTAPSNYFLKIYDRWGIMLFESDDPTIGWDGTYKGKPQPLGTYVYYLQVNCGICTYSNKGDLTLVR